MRKLDDYGFGSKPVGRPRKKRAKGKRGRKKAPVTAARAVTAAMISSVFSRALAARGRESRKATLMRRTAVQMGRSMMAALSIVGARV